MESWRIGRGVLLGIAVLTMLAAACGGRDGAETTPAPTSTAAPTTTATPTTTLPPATTTSVATTTAAPTTTASPQATLLQSIAGEWTGEWINTTFGSMGSIDAVLEVMDDGSVVLTADLGGFVLGQGDPDEERFFFTVDDLGGPLVVETATFGEVTAILSNEGARLTAPDVPADGIANFQLDASFEIGPVIVGTYFVGFDDGTTAEGTIEMSRLDP